MTGLRVVQFGNMMEKVFQGRRKLDEAAGQGFFLTQFSYFQIGPVYSGTDYFRVHYTAHETIAVCVLYGIWGLQYLNTKSIPRTAKTGRGCRPRIFFNSIQLFPNWTSIQRY